jgi:hypothetical protein
VQPNFLTSFEIVSSASRKLHLWQFEVSATKNNNSDFPNSVEENILKGHEWVYKSFCSLAESARFCTYIVLVTMGKNTRKGRIGNPII